MHNLVLSPIDPEILVERISKKVTENIAKIALDKNGDKSESSTLLTRKQVREQYKISYSTIGRLMQNGGFTFIKEGRKTLFKRSDVDNYFESKKTVL